MFAKKRSISNILQLWSSGADELERAISGSTAEYEDKKESGATYIPDDLRGGLCHAVLIMAGIFR